MNEQTKQKNLNQLAKELIDRYQKQQYARSTGRIDVRAYNTIAGNREDTEQEFRAEIRHALGHDPAEPESRETEDLVLGLIRSQIWGYGILDPFVRDETISDIKLYGPKGIRVKRLGKREDAGVNFEDMQEYRRFIMRILERNKINLGTANAIQTFTDPSQEYARLRITAVSGLLTDSGEPCLAIRKIPREKYSITDLAGKGMFEKAVRSTEIIHKQSLQPNEADSLLSLFPLMVQSRGILFTGKGASGKTTLMNAMLSMIPDNESIMICQENEELFDAVHPDLLSVHVMNHVADSKVSYSLGDLTRAALLMDIDRVIVGEVKEGSEAAGLSKASMTGHKCWTSVHGENCRMAVEKMADYISQATGIGPGESLKQLCGFEYVIHLRDFRVDEVIRIDGWDHKGEELTLTEIYPVIKRKEKEWWEI